MRYRTKPCEIEAVRWAGHNHREMYDFLTGDIDGYIQPSGDNFYIDHDKVKGGLVIKTLEGEHIVSIGDYIIKGLVGEFYPCKEEVFRRKYERIELSPRTLVTLVM